MDRSPSFPLPADSRGTRPEGPPAVLRTAFRGGVTSADAYHATRAALRVEGPVLRLGNRFLRLPRYREIAFVALGRAAISQALAVGDALGARVTQGYVAGPEPVPPEVPFRGTEVPDGPPGSAAGVAAARTVLDLAGGLGPNDLLLVLLSPGAFGTLAVPDPARSPEDPGRWIETLVRSGRTSREIALAAVARFGGGVDGGLAAAAGSAEVETIVIERGDGAELVGGAPTRRLTEPERRTAALVGGPGGLPDPPSPLPPNVGRPVIGAGPADALRGAADAVGEKRYRPVLARLSYPEGPRAAARAFTERLDAIVREERGALTSGKFDGLVAFATATLGLFEGMEERSALHTFLVTAREGLHHRGAVVGAFATGGGKGPGDPSGGVVSAGPEGPGVPAVLPGGWMRRGITDVGCLVVALVPAVRA